MTAAEPPGTNVTLPSDQDASGRTLGDEELKLLDEVIRSGTLTSTKGSQVARFETRLAEVFGARFAVACASGTSAVHAAIVAIDPEPGDEIITTAITDMGALAPILYQGAIPVFADVDPVTLNINAATVAERLSTRTRAIVVTHLFGLPADVTAIRELASARGIPVIEDCAQAYLATVEGKNVGTFGIAGCFSLQQGKHITSGEGGFVLTDDQRVARRVRLFVNKAWGYGDKIPDHYFLALNGRMSELQGAVALAQLSKLEGGLAQRRAMARRLTRRLATVPGIEPPVEPDGVAHSYWKIPLRVDPALIPGGPNALAAALRAVGIGSAPRYIQKPAFECAIFSTQRTFGSSRWPFTLARAEAVDYSPELFPGTHDGLDRVLVLPWNERYDSDHVDQLGARIASAVKGLTTHGDRR